MPNDPHDIWVSSNALCRVPVQAAEPIYAGASGTVIGHAKEIVAEFGVAGPEVRRLGSDGEQVNDDYTGEPLTSAVIRGGLFDLQQQAEEKGWTEDEIAMVRAKMEYAERNDPAHVRRHTRPATVAPVPTYDTLHHKQIPTLMEQLGLVPQALAYERENKNRAEVVAKLEQVLTGGRVEAALVAE